MLVREGKLYCECGHRIDLAVESGEVHEPDLVNGKVTAGKFRYTYSHYIKEAFCPGCGKAWSIEEVEAFINQA